MNIVRNVLTSLSVAAVSLLGLPVPVLAQSQQVNYNNLKNRDGLEISLDSSSATALLGDTSTINAVVTNTGGQPLFNVGWTVELPAGVDFVGVKETSGDFGEPKVTTLLYGNGKVSTVVHWNNAADLSPNATATFELEVKNAAPKGSTPKRSKVYAPGEQFEAKAWASGSTNELVLPVFADYGLAGGPLKENQGEGSREWASDRQQVRIEAIRTTMAMSDLVNGIALRGNKANQRQVFYLTLDKTHYGDLSLTRPVTVKIDAAWEVMGVCAKSTDCFIPTPDQLRWDGREWALDIPASAFDFGSGHKAQVHFELAALDRKNVAPTAASQKINMAAYGGDGGDRNPQQDDAARLGAGAAAYANNTGTDTQNIDTTFAGNADVSWTHPWAGQQASDGSTYSSQDNIPITMPRVLARVEDATIKVTTAMKTGGNYKNGELVDKTLKVETNEYASLPANRAIEVTLPKQECVTDQTSNTCVENGPITFFRETGGQKVQVQGTVTTTAGVSKLTIPAASLPETTSASHIFTFAAKVKEANGTTEVVNGKPLKTLAEFSWDIHGNGRAPLNSDGSIPPSAVALATSVAYPVGGQCPVAAKVNPQDDEQAPKSPEEVQGSDKWGKSRLVSAGDELCFQVDLAFPEGIATKDPKLNIYIPAKGELIGGHNAPGTFTYGGTLAGTKQLVLDPANVDAATRSVKKPEERKPIQFTFGNQVPGNATFTAIYKVVIRDGGIVDPTEPPVLWDNLAKLTYVDHEGTFYNARDAANYEFIGPTLVLDVDTKTKEIDRGADTVLTYTVKNVGKGVALGEQPGPGVHMSGGTKVALRLPESVSCADVSVSGVGASDGKVTSTCVDAPGAGHPNDLISGDYLLVTLQNPIGKADEQSDSDQQQFRVSVRTSNLHAPKTQYQLEAGIVSYEKFSTQLQKSVKLLPRHNALCKNYDPALAEDQLEAKDKACALAIAQKLFNAGASAQDVGGEFLVTTNTVKKDNQNTRVASLLTTRNASLAVTGTSSDDGQRTTGGLTPALTITPGEKGSPTITLTPPPSAQSGAPTQPTLTGSKAVGNTTLVIEVTGIDTQGSTDYFSEQAAIRTSIKQALGDSVDENQVTYVPTHNADPNQRKHTITIPLTSFPSSEKTINLANLFTAQEHNVRATATLTYKPLTLVHKDEPEGANRLGADPQAGVSDERVSGHTTFTLKHPTLMISKAVTTPDTRRIVGQSLITYQIQVENQSDVTAYGVQITDTLPVTFKHQAALTSVVADPDSLNGFESQLNWQLADATNQVGTWPAAGTVDLPPGGRLVLTYVATAPDIVTSEQAYRNTIAVPYHSRPVAEPLGRKTYGGDGHADVKGAAIGVSTVLTPQHQRHTNGKVQAGELVQSVTTITIPDKVEVPSLSLLTNLAGATVSRTDARVTIACAGITGCSSGPNLLPGDPAQFGVIITDQTLKNESGSAKTVTVTIDNIRVDAGQGTLTGRSDVYRSAPSNLAGFIASDKVSSGTPGTVEVQKPNLVLGATLYKGDQPVADGMTIEPGQPGMKVQIQVRNSVEGTTARQTQINVKQAIEALGFSIDPSFTQTPLTPPMSWNQGNGVLEIQEMPFSVQPHTIMVPVRWDASKFQSASPAVRTTPVTASAQSGPLNVVNGAMAPETTGEAINTTVNLRYTPGYPVVGLTERLSHEDGAPFTGTGTPTVGIDDSFLVTFTPTITTATGNNPRLCVKAVDTQPAAEPSTALKGLALHEPAQGVELTDPPSGICGANEVEITVPVGTDGMTVPTITFKVESNQSTIRPVQSKVIGTFKVQNRMETTNTGGGTPTYSHTTGPVEKAIRVVPGVNIGVTTVWSKQPKEAIDGHANYNDYDTESAPVSAIVTIANTGTNAAIGAESTVKLAIPSGWSYIAPADTKGWSCAVTDAPNHGELTCSRTQDLPARQTPEEAFAFTLQSPSGPGVRLPYGSLTIRGGYPAGPNEAPRATLNPYDHDPSNDNRVAQATVFVPEPDLNPSIRIPDPILGRGTEYKPFSVSVTHRGDRVRANEIHVEMAQSAARGLIQITNPNGWSCAPLQSTGTITCTYPLAHEPGQPLPDIMGILTPPDFTQPILINAETRWMRPGADAQNPVETPDASPANDLDRAELLTTLGWIDAGVQVSFTNPNPEPGKDAGTKITIHRVGGDANLPGTPNVGRPGTVPGVTTLELHVPSNAQVADSAAVTGCTKTSSGANGQPDVWTCTVTQSPQAGQPLDGPTITGVNGPHQQVVARITWPTPDPNNPATQGIPIDPNPGNNQHSGMTGRSSSVPGDTNPSQPGKPVPPRPEERPTALPKPPMPPSTPAPARPGPRPSITNPIDRAQEWVDTTIAKGEKVRKVLIGRDNVFADSLSSGGLQGMLDAPLLLNPVDHLSDKTKDRLIQLDPEEVIFLGGPVAQSPVVEDAVKALGFTTSRVQGPTRVETAIDAARVHAPTATHGVLARAYASNWGSGSQAFADTLSGGAYAARKEIPVFLTTSENVTPSLKAYLEQAKITHLTLLGSTEALSSGIEQTLKAMGIATTRISGENRAQTAVHVAQHLGYWHGGEAESVLLVDGDHETAWTDAFPAALYAKKYALPILLTSKDGLLPETQSWVALGATRQPPTRVICGFSVGAVQACTHTPGVREGVGDQLPTLLQPQLPNGS